MIRCLTCFNLLPWCTCPKQPTEAHLVGGPCDSQRVTIEDPVPMLWVQGHDPCCGAIDNAYYLLAGEIIPGQLYRYEIIEEDA